MIRITSATNARVKELLKLKKQSKYRQEQGVYLVEGIRMCKEAPIHEIGQIWVSDSFQEQHPEFANEFEMVRTFYEVPDEIFQRLSDTQHPQGVLCVMRQKRYEIGLILKQEHPLLMVLDHLQDPGNVGTILRAGEAAGVTGVILSAGCADIYNPKVIRSTMGSIYRVPFAYVEDLPQTLEELKQRGIHCYAAHLEGKNSYDRESYVKGSAFLIGNEGNGLSEEVAACADIRIRIPMLGQVESLNAAAAATVLMFEAARQRREEIG